MFPGPRIAAIAGVAFLNLAAIAQATGGAVPAGPVTIPADARDVLTMLHDRKATLKDFAGKIDYSVTASRTGDVTGKRGTVDFVLDPTRGPIFSADFTVNTIDGKPKTAYHSQFIFDGKDFTVKDFGTKNDVMQYIRKEMLPPGAKPGDAVTLNGAMPLPIGLDVNDVAQTFEVALTANDASQAVLKLVPRQKGKFDYTQLDVTVDKKLQLPVKLVQTAGNGDETTILLQDLKINTGAAKLANPSVPSSEGWTERK